MGFPLTDAPQSWSGHFSFYIILCCEPSGFQKEPVSVKFEHFSLSFMEKANTQDENRIFYFFGTLRLQAQVMYFFPLLPRHGVVLI